LETEAGGCLGLLDLHLKVLDEVVEVAVEFLQLSQLQLFDLDRAVVDIVKSQKGGVYQ
jgi:hypothetical protein